MKRAAFFFFALLLLATFITSGTAEEPKFVPGTVLVVIKPPYQEAIKVLDKHKLEYRLIMGTADKDKPAAEQKSPFIFAVKVPNGEEQKWIATLQKEPGVTSAELDGIVHAL